LQQRRDRGHALELECDGETYDEQDRKNAPAIAQRLISPMPSVEGAVERGESQPAAFFDAR
jgi:hypothetical protein